MLRLATIDNAVIACHGGARGWVGVRKITVATFPVPALAVASLLLVACGGAVGPVKGPITFVGAASGVYQPGPPAVCGWGPTQVSGSIGSKASRQTADLVIDPESNSVQVNVDGLAQFSGRGVSFTPGKGWDVDAQTVAGGGQRIYVRGHLGC